MDAHTNKTIYRLPHSHEDVPLKITKIDPTKPVHFKLLYFASKTQRGNSQKLLLAIIHLNLKFKCRSFSNSGDNVRSSILIKVEGDVKGGYLTVQCIIISNHVHYSNCPQFKSL